MTNDNINPSRDEIDLFKLAFVLWKNKWLLIIILSISIALGGAYLYNASNNIPTTNHTSINILIENNPIYLQEDIVKQINKNLPSSYNYEKWSKTNKTLSENLTQSYASGLIVTDNTHVVNLLNISENILESTVSYLSNTIKIISDQVTVLMVNEIEDKIGIIENEIKNSFNYNEQLRSQFEIKIKTKRKAYETEINAISNEVINKNIEINAAEEELLFIKENITLETQSSPQIILHQLGLTNQNKVNKLLVQNLLKRKDTLTAFLFAKDKEIDLEEIDTISQIQTSEIALETQLNQKLSDLNAELLSFINEHLSKETQARSDVTLRILDLKNTISSHRVIRGLGEGELYLEIEALAEETKELTLSLNLELKKLNNQLMGLASREIIKLGRITTAKIFTSDNKSKPLIVLIISIMAGLVLGTTVVFLKEEFIKRNTQLKKELKQ